MICILRLEELSPNTQAQPTGWIIATDLDDARRQAQGNGEMDLAQKLYTMYETPPAGKHLIADGLWMLVG